MIRITIPIQDPDCNPDRMVKYIWLTCVENWVVYIVNLELQCHLNIMPTLEPCHFLTLWQGGIIAREVILAFEI